MGADADEILLLDTIFVQALDYIRTRNDYLATQTGWETIRFLSEWLATAK